MPRDWNPIRNHGARQHASPPHTMRRISVLAVIMLLGALLALWGAQHVATGTSGRAAAAAAVAAAPSLKLLRADLHVDESATFSVEVNVAITQMANNTCRAALHGNYCLTYSILKDEQVIHAGYGVIPGTAVEATTTKLRVTLDASTNRSIHRLVGKSGLISLTWTVTSSGSAVKAGNQTTQLAMASVQGSVMGYTVPTKHVMGGLLFAVT